MTKLVVFLFSLIFSIYTSAEKNHELPLEQWSDDDSHQVFAVLNEELNDGEYEKYEEYEEYEEVHFDEQGRIIENNRENYQQNRYQTKRVDRHSARNIYPDISYNRRHERPRYNNSHRYNNRHRHSHRYPNRRQHRRRPPVVVVPPPLFPPPLVSNICRSGPLGNGFYFCYFADGLPRTVGGHCSCYLKNFYTGARIFFRGRVSTW